MGNQRRGGIIAISINGVRYDVKGAAEGDLGVPKRDAIVGQDKVHGFKETPKPAYLSAKFTDRGDLDMKALCSLENATVACEWANGKVWTYGEAWYAGAGTVGSEEGEIDFLIQSVTAEELS